MTLCLDNNEKRVLHKQKVDILSCPPPLIFRAFRFVRTRIVIDDVSLTALIPSSPLVCGAKSWQTAVSQPHHTYRTTGSCF